MRKFYFLLAAFIALGFSAQEAGKAGELLKNEASKTETSAKNEAFGRNNSQDKSSVFRNDNGFRNSTEKSRPNYNWNQNYAYGYAEVFLRIPEQGYFSIEIGDQKISNASGKFRFFDLMPGNNVISIYERNFLVYRTRINIKNNTRLVLDYFTHQGLYLLGTYNLRNNYGNVWNDTWNSPYGNGNGNSWDPYDDYQNDYGYGGTYGNVMSDREFSSFLQMLKKQNFDDRRLDFLKSQLNRTDFNTRQIKSIMKEFSFDKNRLEFAKMAYRNCVDKRNYFELYDAFDFESYARELNKFVQNQR